ncbi:MAG: ATP-binding protein [Halanaerobiales bacterium]
MNNLFGKIFVRFILITLIIIIILGFSLIYFFKNFYFSRKENEIVQNSQVLSEHLNKALIDKKSDRMAIWLESIARINSGQAWVINRDGELVTSYPEISNEGAQIDLEEYDNIFSDQVISRRVESGYFDRPMLLVGMPLEDNKEYGLLIFTSVAGINSTINHVRKLMIYSSLISVFLALIAAYTWSRSLSKPLQKMSKTAMQLSNGNFGQTVEVDEEDEIGTLAESLNYMSSTLKNTINDLTEEKNKLQHVLAGMEEGVLAVNSLGEVVLVNRAAQNFLNINTGKPVGKDLFSITEDKKIINMYSTTLDNKRVIKDEFTYSGNGKKRRALLHCNPIYDEDDNFWGVVGLFQDITERWRFEQLQQDFVANVSHELKAPLSSIRGAGEVLLDDIIDKPEKKREYLAMILDETNRLENLVNKILNLSELDTKRTKIKLESVNVEEIINEVTRIFTRSIEDGKFNFEQVFPAEAIKAKGNKTKLKQVLLNLLDNAVKFSEEGGKIILGAESKNKRVKFWVKDEGQGIPLDEQENIWTRFYKVEKAHTPGESGSGLGLSIVKQIIEESDGEVFVDSEPGEGTIIGFYLPEV